MRCLVKDLYCIEKQGGKQILNEVKNFWAVNDEKKVIF